jgi:capsular polysaccharide biosynthesis protein
VNDPEQTMQGGNGIRDLLAGFGELPSATEATVGLVSLGFIWSALRRARPVWLVTAVIGLVAGVALAIAHPPGHTATTNVLLDTSSVQSGELNNDAAIAESTSVAAAVIAQLHLSETPVDFLKTYSAAPWGNSTQILTITAQGPTDDAAVQRTSVIATQFLKFRAGYLQQQLQQTIQAYNGQVSQAQANLDRINSLVSQKSAEPASPTQQANLAVLQNEQTQASDNLHTVKEDASGQEVQAEAATAQMVKGSEMLSVPAPIKTSAKKTMVLYAVGGLIGGLAISMAIIVIASITSDRLRRRDDIAIAVGAPVMLSVGRLRRRRWVPDLWGRSAQRSRDMERVVAHLRSSVPASSKGAAGLAVVAVDNAPTVAQAVIRLAIASSQQRKRVVLADLSAGAPAARQLSITRPGISTVSPEGVPIVVVVPEAEDIAPFGPLGSPSWGSTTVSEQLAETCREADLVLTVVTLNPTSGSDYLRTWATAAVAMVTAAQSTATRLHAAGEMTRLAGVQLGSVVVVDADKEDESLGIVAADYLPVATVGT